MPSNRAALRAKSSLQQGGSMKISSPSVCSLMIGALILQGCATTGSTGSNVGSAPAPVTQSAGSSLAVPEGNGKPLATAGTRDRFQAVAATVREQMARGGRFEFVSRLERETVEAKLADMQSLFDRFGAVDKMDSDSKIRLFNDQELINGILTRNDSNREICAREVPVGTHFPTMVCHTYGEIRRQQQGLIRFLDRSGPQTKPHVGPLGSGH
jgi:hypothetical protein